MLPTLSSNVFRDLAAQTTKEEEVGEEEDDGKEGKSNG